MGTSARRWRSTQDYSNDESATIATSYGVSRNLVVDSDPEPVPERREVRKVSRTRGSRSSDQTLLGCPLRTALKYLPEIPDQGIVKEFWFLTTVWLNLAFTYHGIESTLKQVLRGIHGCLGVALDQGLDDRDLFHTLPHEFKTAQGLQLMEEFGLPEFLRAILSVSLFYLFFLQRDQYHLFPVIQEALGMLQEWYETFVQPGVGR